MLDMFIIYDLEIAGSLKYMKGFRLQDILNCVFRLLEILELRFLV